MNRIIIVILATLFVAPAVASADQDRNHMAVSITGGGKAALYGLEFEGILSKQFRIGVVVGYLHNQLTVPIYGSWYPWGSNRHGMYLDLGVNLTFYQYMVDDGPDGPSYFNAMPDLGVGYAYTGKNWLFKAGVDINIVQFGDASHLLPWPSIRFGYMF